MPDHPAFVHGELPLRDILGFTFQVNPAFKLVEQGQLSPDQRQFFQALSEDEDHFGLLLSETLPELGVLAVDRESAAFFLGLLEPGPLPAGEHDPLKIAGLVFDGILQVAWKDRFVSGPAALDCLFTQALERPAATGQIAALSLRALQSAQEIPTSDPKVLSSWLYHYNSLPVSPYWARRFSSPERIDEALGLQAGGAVQAMLGEAYIPYDAPGWRAWRSVSTEHSLDQEAPVFKLYLSPHPNALPEALAIAARTMTQAQVPSFKIGKDAFGLLRPDKLVLYFADYDALQAVGERLAKELQGCPAQGVPFTAALSADGLLSWGIDPPRREQIPGWRGAESWRVWVADRLARAILRARVLEPAEMEAWHYALRRLSLEGVQMQTWLPDPAMWKEGVKTDERN
jgi:hypothetical protein